MRRLRAITGALRLRVVPVTLLVGALVVVIAALAWGVERAGLTAFGAREHGEDDQPARRDTTLRFGDRGAERAAGSGSTEPGGAEPSGTPSVGRGMSDDEMGFEEQALGNVRAKHWLLQPMPSHCVSKRLWSTWPWQVFAQWRPDGREVLFSQGPELFAVTADGGAVRRVAQAWRPTAAGPPPDPRVVDAFGPRSVGTMFPFDLSPDGEWLMFVTCAYPRPGSTPTPDGFVARDYENELARVPVAGGEPARVTRNLVFDGPPAWSPDGRRVAFVQGDGRRLSTAAADGSDLRGLVEAPEGSRIWWTAPAWSPDGRHLAFIGRVEDRSSGLYVVPSAGTRLLQLADVRPVTWRAGAPAWSPDGQRLAFARVEDRGVGLYTIAADGTDERRLTSFFDPRLTSSTFGYQGRIRSLAWSPDGAKILLIANPDLWDNDHSLALPVVVDATDGHQVSIELPFPQPENDQLGWHPRAAAWAPDGSRIAVLAELFARRLFDLLDTFPVWPVTLLSVAPDGNDIRVLAQSRLGDNWYNEHLNDGFGPTMTPNGSGVCAAGVVIPGPSAKPALVRDCRGLLEIRQVLQGESFLHWTSKVPVRAWTDLPMRPIDEWPGVEVDGSPPRIRGLVLEGLGGTIPPELARLTALVSLDLSSSYLDGPIPAALGNLAALEHLDLSGNGLTGPIPAELGELANLTHLDLRNNALAGSIPAGLGALPRLERLYLTGNQLTGCIPAELRPTGDHDLGELGLPRCAA